MEKWERKREFRLTLQIALARVYVQDTSWFERLIDPFRMMLDAEQAILKGYRMVPTLETIIWQQFSKGFFQLNFLNTPYVIVDRDHLKELIDAPEEHLSFQKAAGEIVASRYTFSRSIAENSYHIIVIREKLNRNISSLMPEIVDEFDAAFEDEFVIGTGNVSNLSYFNIEWTPIKMFEKTLNVIARVNNRAIVGLPLCHTARKMEPDV